MDAGTHIARAAAVSATLCLCVSVGCERKAEAPPAPERPASCPETRRIDPPMPNVEPAHETAAYWLARNERYGPVDEPLMSPEAVSRHNRALREPVDGETRGQADLLAPLDEAEISKQVADRLAYLHERIVDGTLVDERGRTLSSETRAAFEGPGALELSAELRRSETLEPLRCGPHDGGFYHAPVDLDFDRNRCSTVREGELVQVLASGPDGLALARTSYALGWVRLAALSDPISAEEARTTQESRTAQAFTRGAVLREAFSMLGAPYGWGGKGGGYDCSRFLLELFGRFGIELPRHSARQALAGTFSVDVSTLEDRNEKRLLLEAAARRGVVLLQFPGHIMLYLGTTEDGTPMAIHAFSEFLTKCEGTELETVNRVDRVAVSDLSLGEGSSRQDFLSRITRITVLGGSPSAALSADAELRASAPIEPPEGRCEDSARSAIFRSPLRPDVSRPLRVIVTSERDPGPASLALFDPSGARAEVEQNVLDGPPFSRWVEVAEPSAGRWTAVLADGDRVMACERFIVTKQAAAPEPRIAPGPAWNVRTDWGRATENLYSAFVEQLFREPLGDDATWPNLQALLGERERNLLYDYRAPGEDAALALEPDCADLPYFLRAYFAWKLRLPFVYRMCTRGRKRHPAAMRAHAVEQPRLGSRRQGPGRVPPLRAPLGQHRSLLEPTHPPRRRRDGFLPTPPAPKIATSRDGLRGSLWPRSRRRALEATRRQ